MNVQPPRVIDRAPPGYPGGNLRVTEFGSDPKTFNPILANEESSNDIVEQIFSALLDINFKTSQVVPGLAYKYTHSKDGKTWLIYLRKGLRWSDGQPITADDVVFTFKAIYDPRVVSPVRDIALIDGKPMRVEKVDDTTVRFTLPGPYGPFPFLMASISVLPQHTMEKSLDDGTFSSSYGVNTPPDQVVCSGPFRIKEFVSGERLILERNPYFFAVDTKGVRLPYLDHIVVLYVPDRNTEFLKFISGETDALNEFAPTFYDDLKSGEKQGGYHVVDLGPTAETAFIVLNEYPDPKFLSPVKYRWFTNKLFRQALDYSIDRQAMIRLTYLGHGYISKEDFHPKSRYYDPNVKAYHYDPAKARALFQQAGFHWQGNQMYDSQGNPVSFSLITNSGNVSRAINGEIFKESLAKMGIKVDFHPVDFNELIDKLDHSHDFDAVLIALIDTGGNIEPSNNQNVWLSSGYTHEWYPEQKTPATPWEAEIDKLVREGSSTIDFKKRKAAYDRMQEILYSDEVPELLLPVEADLYAFRNDVGNADPTYVGRFWTNCPDDMLMSQVYIKKGSAQ